MLRNCSLTWMDGLIQHMKRTSRDCWYASFENTNFKKTIVFQRSNLSYKNTRKDDELYGRHLHLKKLLELACLTRYCGVTDSRRETSLNEEDDEQTADATGSIVMDEYYKFEEYKAKALRFAKSAIRRLKVGFKN